jgi:hypothetical protein
VKNPSSVRPWRSDETGRQKRSAALSCNHGWNHAPRGTRLELALKVRSPEGRGQAEGSVILDRTPNSGCANRGSYALNPAIRGLEFVATFQKMRQRHSRCGFEDADTIWSVCPRPQASQLLRVEGYAGYRALAETGQVSLAFAGRM